MLKMELLKTIPVQHLKKKKKGEEKEKKKEVKILTTFSAMNKKERQIKTEIKFRICNHGNGRSLMGRDCRRVALSYILALSTEEGASLHI